MLDAMKIILKMHPLAYKLSIYDVFPKFKSFMGVKRTVFWDKFYSQYGSLRKSHINYKNLLYKPPEISNDVINIGSLPHPKSI